MSNLIDITGQRFGRLTVIWRDGFKSKQATWRCRCDCGNETVVRGQTLRNGDTKSCGCIRNETVAERRTTHGMSKTPTWDSWSNMRRRCFDPKNKSYSDYGFRGITVCERWLTFENFLKDMGVKPEGMTLERVGNDGHYEPGNCVWATTKQQMRNQRKTKKVIYQGKERVLV